MDSTVLESMGQVAGIGGLALGVFLVLFKDLLRNINVPGLTRAQWFKVIITFMILVWSVAIFGLIAWVYAEGQPSPAARSDEVIKFVASNEDTDFGLKGVFEGEVVIGTERMIVRIETGRLTYPEAPPSGESAEVRSLRVSVVGDGPQGWRPIVQSRSQSIARTLAVGDEFQLDPMEFSLSIAEDRIAACWLVFELSDPQGNAWFVHSPPGLF